MKKYHKSNFEMQRRYMLAKLLHLDTVLQKEEPLQRSHEHL